MDSANVVVVPTVKALFLVFRAERRPKCGIGEKGTMTYLVGRMWL